MKRILVQSWVWIFAGLFLGGITHIVSILIMPLYAGQDATTRLRALSAVNAAYILPQSAVGFIYPEPNTAYAICPYDISTAPLRVVIDLSSQIDSGLKMDLSAPYLSAVFLQAGGLAFYALNDRASPSGMLDIRLATPDQMNKIELQDVEDQPLQELRVRAAKTTGVVLVRVVAKNAPQYSEALERAQTFKCGLERELKGS
jgi:uncharacterized membrane protein